MIARLGLGLVVFPVLCASSAGLAQEQEEPFTGPYIGIGVGAANHYIAFLESSTVAPDRRIDVKRWGLAGEAFTGFDLAIASRVRIGVEGQFEIGGRGPVARNPGYTFGVKPRYGYSASVRAGYVVTPKFMIYAGAGYGEHRYRPIVGGAVGPDALVGLDRNASFNLRSGGDFRLNRSASLRLEFEHLDGGRNQFMVGVPIRF